jgi:hypothetical protein
MIDTYDVPNDEKSIYKPETELEDKIQQVADQFEDTLRDMVKKHNVKSIYDVQFKIKLIPLIELDSYNKEERGKDGQE